MKVTNLQTNALKHRGAAKSFSAEWQGNEKLQNVRSKQRNNPTTWRGIDRPGTMERELSERTSEGTGKICMEASR